MWLFFVVFCKKLDYFALSTTVADIQNRIVDSETVQNRTEEQSSLYFLCKIEKCQNIQCIQLKTTKL